MARGRALFIAPMMPALGGNGLAMRLGLFLEALAAVADVDLVVVPAAGGPSEATAYVGSLTASIAVIPLEAGSDTHFRLLSLIADPALRLRAFVDYGRPSLTAASSSRTRQTVERLAHQTSYRLIHVSRSYMMPLIGDRPERHPPITLDLDEDDCRSFASRASFARRRGEAGLADWLEQEGRAFDLLISETAGSCSRIFAASKLECATIVRRHPNLRVEAIANAVIVPRRAPSCDDGRTLLFVGSFGYEPNVDAALWFARRVMPILRARWFAVRLVVAGANPPAAVRRLGRHPDIKVLGFVDDLSRLYRRATLAIAPMLAGGGTRIKVLEAAAHGIASVVSEEAAQGLFTRREPWGFIASTPTQFADACMQGLGLAEVRRRRAQAGRRAVDARFSRSGLIRRLANVFHDCIVASGEGEGPRHAR